MGDKMTEEDRIARILDWESSGLLAWVGLFLASIVGIIELLPLISILSWLSLPACLLYWALVGAIFISIRMATVLLQDITKYHLRLTQMGWEFPVHKRAIRKGVITDDGGIRREVILGFSVLLAFYFIWLFISNLLQVRSI